MLPICCRVTRQVERNETAKLRGRVLRVLEHETTEIRLYLDRPDPDPTAALARLAHLEELAAEIAATARSEGG